ncbi:hypothetical protein NHX12_032867 [Muraenolepis orangiensis]|uniref:TM2 domain-containing protein n=1 Tax=Muraenolepis orangiensis TaxID=630683 RepID=A0A9Q0E2M9_9TELE|nr:hypothetical protein NHX12_032867 [Muraenolepis orangiensis]
MAARDPTGLSPRDPTGLSPQGPDWSLPQGPGWSLPPGTLLVSPPGTLLVSPPRDPTDPKIDEATQEAENCRDRVAWVECRPAPNISCRLDNGTEFRFSGEEVGFNKTTSCRKVSGYSYKVAVALSLFLGWLGADRFYLGYPALVLHGWILWDRQSDGLPADRHADGGPLRWF